MSDCLLVPAPPAALPQKFRAASTAERVWKNKAFAVPELINIAALAEAMRATRQEVHVVTHDAAALVDATDLHALPSEPPRLLRAPVIVQARHPLRQLLVGSVVEFGLYAGEGEESFVVALTDDGGALVGTWRPRWTGEDLDETVALDTSPLIDDVSAHRDTMRQITRWLVVYAMLLEAQSTPLAEHTPRRAKGKRRRAASPLTEWVERRIHLDDSVASGLGSPGGAARADGLVPAEVPVSGYIRRQPYGPGGSLRRLVYVRATTARRWVSPRPRRTLTRA